MQDERDRVSELVQELIVGGKKVQHQFSIDYTDLQGNKFEGFFTVHRPTIGEKIRIGVLDSRLRQELDVDIYTGNMSYMVATLLVVVDHSPDWWKPAQIYDFDLLAKVYNTYIKWNNTFFRKDDAEHGGDKDSAISKNDLVDTENGRSPGNERRPAKDFITD